MVVSRCILFLFLACLSTQAQAAAAAQKPWSQWSQEEKADLYMDLDYSDEGDVPAGFKIIDLKKDGNFNVELMEDKAQKVFAKTVLRHFDNKFSREDIEQSEYSKYGDEEVMDFLLVIDNMGCIVGGMLRVYQDGRDQDGNDSDVNWQAVYRFDGNGDPLLDENGHEYDEMYFSWSGH